MKLFLRNHIVSLAVTAVVVGGIIAAWTLLSLQLIFIQSGSMQPTLPVGTIALVMPTQSLEPTDIITFREPDGHLVTHTFIGYDVDGTLLTKGDANPTPDVHTPALTEQDVVGKVVSALPPKHLAAVVLLVVIILMARWWMTSSRESESESQSNPTSTDTPVGAPSPA